MGNTLDLCFPAARTVRVYHGDNGDLLQFSCRPIPSGRLMGMHPNYLLVYTVVQARQTTAAVEGQVPQHHAVHIRIVRPGELLQIGKAYYLCFIPDQYRDAFAKYLVISRRSDSSAASGQSPSPTSSSGSTNSTASSGSPGESPGRSPGGPPQYIPMVSPRPIRSYRRLPPRWRHSIMVPPGSPLYSVMRSAQSNRMRTMSPQSRSGIPSTLDPPCSPTGSRQLIRNRTTYEPRPSLAPPLSTSIPSSQKTTRQSIYIPSPLREQTTRAANLQHSLLNNPEQENEIQILAGQSPPSDSEVSYESIITPHIQKNRNTLANMISEDMQRSTTSRSMESPRSIESPGTVIPPLQGTTRRSIPYHNVRNRGHMLMRSPGRAIPPTQDTLRRILYHNLQQRSPRHRLLQQSPGRTSPATQETLRNVLYRNLPDGSPANKAFQSSGGPMSPGTTTQTSRRATSTSRRATSTRL